MAKRRGQSAYNKFVKKRMPEMLAQGYSAPEAMKHIGKEWSSGKRNPDVGDIVETIAGPAKISGKKSGFLGMGTKYRITGPMVPGESGYVSGRAIRSGTLSNPVFACPMCQNPIRGRHTRRCKHCGSSLRFVG